MNSMDQPNLLGNGTFDHYLDSVCSNMIWVHDIRGSIEQILYGTCDLNNTALGQFRQHLSQNFPKK